MLKNLTIDNDVFIYIVKEEFELLIIDAVKNSKLQYFSESLYSEILEFSSIVQKLVRALRRKESELKRGCVTSSKDEKYRTKQLSEIDLNITELETMVNDLMNVIGQEY